MPLGPGEDRCRWGRDLFPGRRGGTRASQTRGNVTEYRTGAPRRRAHRARDTHDPEAGEDGQEKGNRTSNSGAFSSQRQSSSLVRPSSIGASVGPPWSPVSHSGDLPIDRMTWVSG